MPLFSMTGFSRNTTCFDFNNKHYSWDWEIKSVNAKGMDIKVKLPATYEDLEQTVKKTCAEYFSRGTFYVSLNMRMENYSQKVQIDEVLLAGLIRKMTEIYNSDPTLFTKSAPADLLKITGVVKLCDDEIAEDEKQALKEKLCKSLQQTAEDLKKDRALEGVKITEDLKNILISIEKTVSEVEKIFKNSSAKLREKLCAQIRDLASDCEISPERLEQEVLFLVMRADIKEELDRLTAHLKTGFELLASNGPVGRRLDFLSQELNREANTLCSKSADIEQTKYGMDLKALIEQFREQVQNME